MDGATDDGGDERGAHTRRRLPPPPPLARWLHSLSVFCSRSPMGGREGGTEGRRAIGEGERAARLQFSPSSSAPPRHSVFEKAGDTTPPPCSSFHQKETKEEDATRLLNLVVHPRPLSRPALTQSLPSFLPELSLFSPLFSFRIKFSS